MQVQRHVLKAGVAALLLAAVCVGSAGAGRGATIVVPANTIWFADAARLAHWQKLRDSDDPVGRSDYQEKLLHRREAFQFLRPLTVRLLGHDRARHRLVVQMISPGRFQRTMWYLDDAALHH
jgi:hypothetical protein